MAEDPFDDAIAAVINAVDRIEQVTLGVLDAPLPSVPASPPRPEPRTPPPPAFSTPPSGFGARPTTATTPPPAPEPDPSWSDYELSAAPEHAAEQAPEPAPIFEQPQQFEQTVDEAPSFEQPQPLEQPPVFQQPQQFDVAQQFEPGQQFVQPQHFEPAPVAEPFAEQAEPAHASDDVGAFAPEQEALSEVHELVGRIVARTQLLEEHLDAARTLRFEITELVSRLSAAAEREH